MKLARLFRAALVAPHDGRADHPVLRIGQDRNMRAAGKPDAGDRLRLEPRRSQGCRNRATKGCIPVRRVLLRPAGSGNARGNTLRTLAGDRPILAKNGRLQASRPQIDAKKVGALPHHVIWPFRPRRPMPICPWLSQHGAGPAKA